MSRLRSRVLSLTLAALLGVTLVLLATTVGTASPGSVTSYELAWAAPFNRPGHYPLDQRPDPSLYRPHAEWMGRLILPGKEETAARREDWVWIELEQAPAEHVGLIGQKLRLRWRQTPVTDDLIGAVTTDIRLGASARKAAGKANVIPTRLNGRRDVGPLQTLAGARPHDDVTVELEDVSLAPGGWGAEELLIGRSPVQITGRWSALVRLLGPDPDRSTDSDRYQARHYNPSSGAFDGPLESIRLPRQPPDRSGRRPFDPSGIETSPLGSSGWRIHGSPDAEGVFTVQALEPRALFQLNADQTVEGLQQGLRHISRDNWRITETTRGSFRRTSLPGEGQNRPWQLGDEAVLIHNFGGIGGVKGEEVQGFTVTGHFAFGEARVISDPLTGEPRFAIRYHQIYANNPNGIVSGTQDWSAYSGNLQRGWMGTRPISDVIVRSESGLVPQLAIQAQVLMARYRSGDGTGISTVTPSTSCVQDSSQALWIAIDLVRGRPHPRDGDDDRGLTEMASDVEALLTPFGMVRADWRHNAGRIQLALDSPGRSDPSAPPSAEGSALPATQGIAANGFRQGQSLWNALLSWRSMLPRGAHDAYAGLLLQHGRPLWILRTNQVPGSDPALAPMAPTTVLGRLPLVSTLLERLSDAVFMPITVRGLGLTALLLGLYAGISLPLGFRSGWLTLQGGHGPAEVLRHAAGLLLMPSLVEELVFRVALIPHPSEGLPPVDLVGWGALSIGLFVLYHPLSARLWYPKARQVFADPIFLSFCTLLALVLVAAYVGTGSLWTPVGIHWLVVVVWLEFLGGRTRLSDASA